MSRSPAKRVVAAVACGVSGAERARTADGAGGGSSPPHRRAALCRSERSPDPGLGAARRFRASVLDGGCHDALDGEAQRCRLSLHRVERRGRRSSGVAAATPELAERDVRCVCARRSAAYQARSVAAGHVASSARSRPAACHSTSSAGGVAASSPSRAGRVAATPIAGGGGRARHRGSRLAQRRRRHRQRRIDEPRDQRRQRRVAVAGGRQLRQRHAQVQAQRLADDPIPRPASARRAARRSRPEVAVVPLRAHASPRPPDRAASSGSDSARWSAASSHTCAVRRSGL